MKKVQAQRKFAQGVYTPTSTNINAVIDRRTDVGAGRDSKNVFHNKTSAKTLLDIVSLENLHSHSPIVLIERLSEDNLKMADDSKSINSNNNLLQPVVEPQPLKVSKFNFRMSTLKKSESTILRCRNAKKRHKTSAAKKVSKSTKRKERRKPLIAVDYETEDDLPLKFISMDRRSKEAPPGNNDIPLRELSKASTSKEASSDIPLRELSKASTSKEASSRKKRTTKKNITDNEKVLSKVRNSKEAPSGNKGGRKKQNAVNNLPLTFLSQPSTSKEPDTSYDTYNENTSHEFPSEVRDSDQEEYNHDTRGGITDMEYSFDDDEYDIDESQYNTNNDINTDREYVLMSTNNDTEINTAEIAMDIEDCNAHEGYATDFIEDSARNVVERDTNNLDNNDDVDVESLNSEVQDIGNELESVKDSDSDGDSVSFNFDDNLIDVEEEKADTEGLDDITFNKIIEWLGVTHAHAGPSTSGNYTRNEGERNRQANKVCKAITTRNLCKMLKRENSVNAFIDTVKEKFKNRCCKCIECRNIYRSCTIIHLLKDHQEKFHRERSCRLACISKNEELVIIDLTDSNIQTRIKDNRLLTVIKENLIGDSENLIDFNRIKYLTRDIILGLNSVNSNSSIYESSNGDSDASSDVPIMTRRRGNAKISKGILNPQPGTAPVIRSKLVDAPVFNPTADEFQDPVAYFEKIMPIAAKYGLCKVVPPADFRPACHLKNDMRFRLTHQYIARVYKRWGEHIRELSAIRASAAAQKVVFARPPLIGGIEVDLVKMFKAVQREGGIKELNKKKWQKIAEELRCTGIPNPDKILDSMYLKCLVPYNSLSKRARQDYINELEMTWRKKNQKILERAMNPLHRQKRLLGEFDSSNDEEVDDNADPFITSTLQQVEDCVVKGRSTDLGNYKRVARNASRIFSPNSASIAEIETSYWNIVQNGQQHVCVDSASIDTGTEGYGFTKHPYEPYGNHPWNLKMLSQNKGNVLRLLGPVTQVTVPTLHVGMVYSTSCWHRDPHGLPWIEYLHEGSPKIWYGISDEESYRFRKAVENLSPTTCQNKTLWLPSDVTMIPPKLLLEQGVSLSRVVQRPGEFIIVFPKSYSSSICTGYNVSESVYFATNSWVNSIHQVFQEARDSCEPTQFSLEQLLFSAARDSRASPTLLQLGCTKLISIVNEEIDNRNKARLMGLEPRYNNCRNNSKPWSPLPEDECEICGATLYMSRVKGVFHKSSSVCITHALRVVEDSKINKRENPTQFEIFFTNTELEDIINVAKNRLIHIKPRRS